MSLLESASVHLSKRGLLQGVCYGTAAIAAGFVSPAPALAATEHKRTDLSAEEALELLRQGNANFMADKVTVIPVNRERRLAIARGQTPFAVLVGCSDSRVPPEILFGRGLGELFIIRVAGNTIDPAGLGSVEYAVAELGVPLIVVLGHERCGACAAAVAAVTENTTFPGAINDMVSPIIPAVLAAQSQPGDLLDNVVRENVKRVVARLEASGPIIGEPHAAGRLKIVGARYDLDDGSVEFFDS
jgi:carbonic anhydrase